MKHFHLTFVTALLCICLLVQYAFAQDMEDFDDDDGLDMMDEMAGGMDDMLDVPVGKNVEVLPRKTAPYSEPSVASTALFYDTFQSSSKWVVQKDEKFTGDVNFAVREKETMIGDMGMKIGSASSYHRAVAKFDKPMTSNEGKSFYAAYEVQYEKDVKCGGAYFKLFNSEDGGLSFDDSTPYVIMFGPDRCGLGTNKVHLIIKFQNPKTGEWVEAHLKNPPKTHAGSEPHSYGFAIHPNNSYTLYGDGDIIKTGDLTKDFEPGFKNAPTIKDPADKQPDDWVTEAKIADPSAVKPADWNDDAPEYIIDEAATMPEGWLVNEPLLVENVAAVKPEDWDDEEDGIWKAPLTRNPRCSVGCGPWTAPKVKNPEYKGVWKAPLIDNPEFKGPWTPREIPNPDYFEVAEPYKLPKFNTVGFEIWTVDDGAVIDNMILTHNEKEFHKFIDETLKVKADLEKHNAAADKSAAAAAKSKQEGAKERNLNSASSSVTSNPIVIGLLVLVVCGGGVSVLLIRMRSQVAEKIAASGTEQAAAKEKKASGERKASSDAPEKEKDSSSKKGSGDAAEDESTMAAGKDESAEGLRKRKGSEKKEAPTKELEAK